MKLTKRLPPLDGPSFSPAAVWWLGAFGIAAIASGGTSLPLFPGAALRWLGLMLAPGAAIYLFAERNGPRLSRLVLASLTLSPVCTAVFGTAGLLVHAPVVTIAGAIAAAGLGLTAVAFLRLRERIAPPDRRSWVWLTVLLSVLVVLTAYLPMTRAWWRIRSDAWFHAAVVSQIRDYGLPPQDPYFAGMTLQYMWFYHVLVLVLARGLEMDPFRVMALLNVQALVALGVGAWQLSGVFRRSFSHRLAATAMMLLGFDGAFWVFLPVKLARAVIGEVRGVAEIRRTFSLSPFDYDSVRSVTGIYFNQEFFLDKFMVATAFGLALAFLAATWYGAADYLRTRRRASLTIFAGALVGMLGFHSMVGFVTLAGMFGAALGMWMFRRHGDPIRVRDVLVVLAVALAGIAAMTPYLYTVMHLKEKQQVFPLNFSLKKTAGILISCAFALTLALRRRSLWADRSCASRFFLFGTVSVAAFCLIIRLPGPNTYDKLGYLVFMPLSVLGGIALGDMWEEADTRGRRRVLALAFAFMVPLNVLVFSACFATPDRVEVTAPEAKLSLWLRDHTPRDALIVDDGDRVPFVVTVPRRYIFGCWAYASQWGYPRVEMSRRAHMRRALYSPGTLDASALDVLGEAAQPVFAIVRPEHRAAQAAVVSHPDLFHEVYEDDGYGVVRVDTDACRALAAQLNHRLSAEELIRESGL